MSHVLGRECFACGAIYCEHTLAELAECMESIAESLEEPDEESSVLTLVPRRRIEEVRGPTLRRVL